MTVTERAPFPTMRLLFLAPFMSTILITSLNWTISSTIFIAAHRIELQELRHLAGGKSTTSTVVWDNSSDDDTSSETLEDSSSSGDESETTLNKKTRQQKKELYKECIPVDECQYCTADVTTPKSNHDEATVIPLECMDTGRRQRFECIIEDSNTDTKTSSSDASGSISSSRTEILYKSCRSTPAEDYFAVVRMQLICLVLGILSLREVNKQKRLSASMFDQRRYYSSGSSSTTSAGSASSNANNKLSRKTSDAGPNYAPVPTSDTHEDTAPGSNSKAKPSSTANKFSSTMKLNFAESAV